MGICTIYWSSIAQMIYVLVYQHNSNKTPEFVDIFHVKNDVEVMTLPTQPTSSVGSTVVTSQTTLTETF